MNAQVYQLHQKAMVTDKPTAELDRSLSMLSGTVQAIKDRKRFDAAREREDALLVALRALLDCRSAPTWLKSADQRRMLYINPQYTREFGITYDTYGGHSDGELWADEVAAVFCENDLQVLELGEEMEFEEYVTVKGEPVLYRIRKWPAVLDGVVLGVAGESLGPVHARD